MAIRSFKYYFKEAIAGMARNGLMTVASLITVTSCLLLFGVFMLFSININFIGEQIQSQCEIQAFINFEATPEQEQGVVRKVSELANVRTAVFESKAEAMENYRRFLGADAAALDGLEGEQILRSSVKITMKDLRQSDALFREIEGVENVATVKNRKDLVEKVLRLTDIIRTSSLAAMLVFLMIAIFIISNTIKLSVHAREDEIHIMRYVGATDHFIRWPFVIEGMLLGLLGGIASTLLVGVGYNALVGGLRDFLDIFQMRPFGEIGFAVSLTTVCFGILMGTAGSMFSIRNHLLV